ARLGRLHSDVGEARLVLKRRGHPPKCRAELDAIKEAIMSEGPVAAIIREKLQQSLSPSRLEIVDDSWRHAGHHHEGGMDAKPGGESHFNIVVVSDAFEGQSRLARQRAVNDLLRAELAGPVHALSVRALTPVEDSQTNDR
ncbi:BolA family protein, partial [Rhizobium ruizarguesonis]|uniref:BolA family protein n=2 Tax=Alphaproteobacteria TaxID=28211 RepID=UPI0029623256